MTDPGILFSLPDEALVDTRTAASVLNMEPRSLERLRRERLIPHIKLSHTAARYRMGDLRAWLAARYVPAEAA